MCQFLTDTLTRIKPTYCSNFFLDASEKDLVQTGYQGYFLASWRIQHLLCKKQIDILELAFLCVILENNFERLAA